MSIQPNGRPPFRADHIGSLLRPRKLRDAFRAHAEGKLDERAFRAAQDEAIRDVVKLQEDCGLQVVTDGEFRRISYWEKFVRLTKGLVVKEAALEAVCADGVEDYALRALAIQRGPGNAADKVAQLVVQHLAPMRERLDFTLAFLRERRFLPEPARKRIRAIERRYERIIERVISEGSASGEFRADLDARMATLALLGLGNSAALWYGREPGATHERIVDSYVDLLLRAFRGDAVLPRARVH